MAYKVHTKSHVMANGILVTEKGRGCRISLAMAWRNGDSVTTLTACSARSSACKLCPTMSGRASGRMPRIHQASSKSNDQRKHEGNVAGRMRSPRETHMPSLYPAAALRISVSARWWRLPLSPSVPRVTSGWHTISRVLTRWVNS